jgi:hypothetical protein
MQNGSIDQAERQPGIDRFDGKSNREQPSNGAIAWRSRTTVGVMESQGLAISFD